MKILEFFLSQNETAMVIMIWNLNTCKQLQMHALKLWSNEILYANIPFMGVYKYFKTLLVVWKFHAFKYDKKEWKESWM